jgi:hypothetical protein
MEIAIAKLEDLKPTTTESKEESTRISGSDVTTFVEMQCAQKALKRICEYKGMYCINPCLLHLLTESFE